MELSRAAGVQRLTYLASLLLCLGSIALLVAMLIFGQRLVHWLNYDWIAISLFLSIGTVLESLVRNRNGAVPLIVYWGFLTCQFLQWLGRESLSVLSLIDILFLGSVVVGLLTAIINILVTQRGGSRSTVKS